MQSVPAGTKRTHDGVPVAAVSHPHLTDDVGAATVMDAHKWVWLHDILPTPKLKSLCKGPLVMNRILPPDCWPFVRLAFNGENKLEVCVRTDRASHIIRTISDRVATHDAPYRERKNKRKKPVKPKAGQNDQPNAELVKPNPAPADEPDKAGAEAGAKAKVKAKRPYGNPLYVERAFTYYSTDTRKRAIAVQFLFEKILGYDDWESVEPPNSNIKFQNKYIDMAILDAFVATKGAVLYGKWINVRTIVNGMFDPLLIANNNTWLAKSRKPIEPGCESVWDAFDRVTPPEWVSYADLVEYNYVPTKTNTGSNPILVSTSVRTVLSVLTADTPGAVRVVNAPVGSSERHTIECNNTNIGHCIQVITEISYPICKIYPFYPAPDHALAMDFDKVQKESAQFISVVYLYSVVLGMSNAKACWRSALRARPALEPFTRLDGGEVFLALDKVSDACTTEHMKRKWEAVKLGVLSIIGLGTPSNYDHWRLFNEY